MTGKRFSADINFSKSQLELVIEALLVARTFKRKAVVKLFYENGDAEQFDVVETSDPRGMIDDDLSLVDESAGIFIVPEGRGYTDSEFSELGEMINDLTELLEEVEKSEAKHNEISAKIAMPSVIDNIYKLLDGEGE